MTGITSAKANEILRFARQHVGRTVGNGECFTLADNALRAAGVQSASDFGRVRPGAFYQWGEEIPLAQARPGDILQFRNFRVTIRIDRDDGSWNSQLEARAQHTAILVELPSSGPAVVLESNIGGNRAVQRNQIHLRTRPSHPTDEGNVTVNVTGRIQAYRPQQG